MTIYPRMMAVGQGVSLTKELARKKGLAAAKNGSRMLSMDRPVKE
jgi:hypothetical protein